MRVKNFVLGMKNYKNSTMLHLFSPHYSMGLNITNEMNICTFFHGVSAFREFHSFIVLIYVSVCVYIIHSGFCSLSLSLSLSIWLYWAWKAQRARYCCCHRAYVFDVAIVVNVCVSANNIFFQSHTFFSVDLLHML